MDFGSPDDLRLRFFCRRIWGSESGLRSIFERGLEIPNMPLKLIAGSGQGDHAGSFIRCLPERFDRYLPPLQNRWVTSATGKRPIA